MGVGLRARRWRMQPMHAAAAMHEHAALSCCRTDPLDARGVRPVNAKLQKTHHEMH